MDEQVELLKEGEWDILLILDSCRFDLFALEEPTTCGVISPGTDTITWLKVVSSYFKEAFYITASPVVSQEVANKHVWLETEDIWGEHYGCWADHYAETVHPASVTGSYLMWRRYRGDGRKVVLHFMQPHTPYIGENSVKFNWGEGQGNHINSLVSKGILSWPEIKEGYIGNLRLVMQAVRSLIPHLKGRVVITSDHGELLGERDHFGHGPEEYYDCKEVREVPWMVVDPDRILERTSTERRIRALGYM